MYGEEFRERGGWGAWLGTGIALQLRIYRTYDEAVTFVHELRLKNLAEWRAYCRGERSDLPEKPEDVPASPKAVYGKEFVERGGSGGWLGTGFVARQLRTYRSYDEAVVFVNSLGLTGASHWDAYCRGRRPGLPEKLPDVPAQPRDVYRDEFIERGGWGAWLGTGNRQGGWRTYEEAVTFVHGLGLKNYGEWRAYCRGERPDLSARPADIPRDARNAYGKEFRERGGLGAWLGTGSRRGGWRTHHDAVTFVHGLKLKSQTEWRAYCRGERQDLPKKPADIPAAPARVHGDEFRERGG